MSKKLTYEELEQRVKELESQLEQVAETLRVSNERNELASSAAKVGVWDWNIKTGDFYLSPSVKAILGYNDDEIPNDLEIWAKYVHPEDIKAVMEAAQECLDGKTSEYIFEHRMLHKDGSIRWILVRGKAIRDESGKAVRMVGTDTDITEHKQAEGALRESEGRFRHLSEATFEAIVFHDEGKILHANNQYYEMFGFMPEELADKDAIMLTATPDSIKLMKHQISLGNLGPYEVMGLKKSGVEFPIEIRVKFLEYHGRKIRMAAIRDLTDRKQAEEALQESEARLRQVIDLVPHFIFAKDRNGRFILVNQAVAEAYGTTVEELIGKTDANFNPNKDEVEHFLKDDLQVMDIGQPKYVPEEKITDSKGNIRILRTTKIPFTLSMTKDDAVLGVSIDITKDKQAEEERRNIEAQLQQAQKMEALGTLVGGIAHEFNNVIGVIIGNTELSLHDVPDWNPAHYNLKEIKAASLRAKDVVRQLLSYLRKVDYKKKPMKVVPVVKDSIRFMRSTIPTSIDIRQNMQATADTILADPTQIHQIMLNLCTNAAHAMEGDGGVLEIEIQNVNLGEESVSIDPDLIQGNYIKITISDTGQGISPEIIDRIFDPFFTTKEVGKGTGMGLSVVHGIVKSYKGAVSIESELGEGTTLSVFFPLTEEETVIESKTVEVFPTGNEKILFVDDEELMVNMGKQILERLGYQVETKMNSVDALELFRSKSDQFDLVITDMAMPQMDGDKLVKEILKTRPEIPIILCTGFSEKVSEENAKELGIRAFATKPLIIQDFAVTVRQVLDKK
jgi:PAS domain S-box-containing protein